jgi:hypothetical protein
MRRYPNGNFLYWCETDESAKARHREWVEQRRITQPAEALRDVSMPDNVISFDAYRRERHQREWDRPL